MRREEKQALIAMSISIFIALLPVIIPMCFVARSAVRYYLHPFRKVVIDEEEQQLREKNNKAMEDSILENCTEDGVYNFNELIPFEWDTVYFIKPNIKDNMHIDVSNIYDKAGCYWDYVYDIGDPSDPYAQTHVLFKKDGKIVAYRPNMPFTKPYHIYLYDWNEGEFESADNPRFNITVEESVNGSSISICLTSCSD